MNADDILNESSSDEEKSNEALPDAVSDKPSSEAKSEDPKPESKQSSEEKKSEEKPLSEKSKSDTPQGNADDILNEISSNEEK